MAHPIQIQLPIPFAVSPVNSYLFLDPVPTLVDCGVKSDESWAALSTALAQHQLTMADIQRVIITHAHVDHIGMAGQIAAHSQAKIWVAAINYEWAVNPAHKWQQRMAFMQIVAEEFGLSADQQAAILAGMARTLLLWEPVPAERVVTFPLEGVLEIGGEPWQIIYAPGHSNTQTCFYQPTTRQFLSADMLLPITPTPVVEEPLDGSEERIPGLPQFLDSLALVEELEIEWVYPGHGAPFVDHRGLIERQSNRIAQRTAQCHDLIQAEPRTFGALLTALYGGAANADHFSALGMLVGYLDLLELEGLIRRRRQGDQLLFEARA
ncbi:MAG: MBL fold metallo-hydrolase [Caldilineaceae bacterium]|nr:MBL fold metallo-hydrolase [Caldilineaceae bacterium]